MSTDTRRPQTPASVVLVEAINAVLKSFAKHSADGTVIASEALQEFWELKCSKDSNKILQASITYDMETEIINGKKKYFICYVTLPGGSCYGSSPLPNEKSARESAAKVALMNSVFNEHPSRQINAELIRKILSSVASGRSISGHKKFQSCLDAFKSMLLASEGKSLLMFQEMMVIFQLLHWNGNLKEMKRRQCSREEVIARYASAIVDQRMRDGMVRDWTSKELKLPGIVHTELSVAEESMRHCREVGIDLRFHREKRDILRRIDSDMPPIIPVSPTKNEFVSLSPAINKVADDNINVFV